MNLPVVIMYLDDDTIYYQCIHFVIQTIRSKKENVQLQLDHSGSVKNV